MKALFALLPLAALIAGCIEAPVAPKRQPVKRSAAVLPQRPEDRQCLADLGSAQARFTPIPDQYYGAGCSMVGTVNLSRLRSDDATLGVTNLGAVTCPLANTFANWARYGVDRAAQQILGSALVRIETMGSYSCRNISGSARRSAHATANAIDVSAFVLADGRRISIGGDWSEGTESERRFLETIHSSACKRFGTVLSPGYNRAHHDHLHLELSGRKFCR